jgi:hypothetical protein
MTNTIDLTDVQRQAGLDEIWTYIGHATQAYAAIEQSLCYLLSYLSETKPDIAAIIFYRIVNNKSREQILEKLLKKKHGADYSLFWNSFAKILRELTETRNHCMHWHSMTYIGSNGFEKVILRPPQVFNILDESQSITKEGLLEFITKCMDMTKLCNMFTIFLSKQFPLENLYDTWRGIFQQPITYPLPHTHPLSQKLKAPENQPPPSGESPQSQS